MASRQKHLREKVQGERAYLTAAAWIGHDDLGRVLLGSNNHWLGNRWQYSARAAFTILWRRAEQGLITDKIRAEYMFYPKGGKHQTPRWLSPG
ncbi:MAG: hypothetical protein QGF09_10185 [Rhodospirillales bacterium]|jgi:hypothetical protein|nr:hypothetical protein [Rhodospirillales bacterium]